MANFVDNSGYILAYLKLFQDLSGEGAEACPADLEEILAGERETFAPAVLRRRFGLDRREFLLMMAALALEMDGALRGGFRRRYGLDAPTVEYGLRLIEGLCPTEVSTLGKLAGRSALMELLLAPPGPERYPLERPLILCRAVLTYLTGFSSARVPGIEVWEGEKPGELVPLFEEKLARIKSWHAGGAAAPLLLKGPAGSGRRTLLRRACGGGVWVELEEVEEMTAQGREKTLREAAVTALLLGVPVCAAWEGEGKADALARFCRRHQVPLAILSEEDDAALGEGEAVTLPRRLSRPAAQAAWRFFVPEAEADAAPEGAMTVSAVRALGELARRYGRQAGRSQVRREDVLHGELARSGGELDGEKDAAVSLEDMVLPQAVREELELICQSAQKGPRLSAWGLSGGQDGVTAVFHGPSGTGKTMAAAAIAHALGAPLLRADLAQIMDKYVGETEKRLERLLRRGEERRCVLLFDEADVLFSRRGEVDRGQDKYANLSTAYLLQEIERYQGVALLSTNLLRNFDEAFLRRLQYIVRFPMPDRAAREELWRRALPPERREGDVPFARLAGPELSPARIRAAVRNAALEALAAGRERVDAQGLLRALGRELAKSGKPQSGGFS